MGGGLDLAETIAAGINGGPVGGHRFDRNGNSEVQRTSSPIGDDLSLAQADALSGGVTLTDGGQVRSRSGITVAVRAKVLLPAYGIIKRRHHPVRSGPIIEIGGDFLRR